MRISLAIIMFIVFTVVPFIQTGFCSNDKATVIHYLKMAQEEELHDSQKSLEYAVIARDIARNIVFDSAEVRAMIIIGTRYIDLMKIYDAIQVGSEIIEKAQKYNMKLEEADGRTIMALAYAQAGDFDNSSRLYFQNIEIYEKLNQKRLLGGIYGNIAVDFIEQKNYSKALEYLNKALLAGKEANDLLMITDQYINLAGLYENGYLNHRKALYYFFKAKNIAEKTKDYHQLGMIYLNIGNVYLTMNINDSCYFYLTNAHEIFTRNYNPSLLASTNISIGEYFYKTGKQNEAITYAKLGLNEAKKLDKLQTIFNAADLLHQINLKNNDTVNAYQYIVLRGQVEDSLNSLQDQKELFRLEFKYNKEKALKEQKIKQLKYFLILGFAILITFSGLIITLLIISKQKMKVKNTTLEKDKALEQLQFKNKELSINLMALLKKSEIIELVSQKLTELNKIESLTEVKEIANRIIQEIKLHSDDRLWQEFSIRFNENNSEFYSRMQIQFPNLSKSELNLCAYLRLNMSSKEISEITGQRVETIETARYRLRKKLGLNNTENTLSIFLSQI